LSTADGWILYSCLYTLEQWFVCQIISSIFPSSPVSIPSRDLIGARVFALVYARLPCVQARISFTPDLSKFPLAFTTKLRAAIMAEDSASLQQRSACERARFGISTLGPELLSLLTVVLHTVSVSFLQLKEMTTNAENRSRAELPRRRVSVKKRGVRFQRRSLHLTSESTPVVDEAETSAGSEVIPGGSPTTPPLSPAPNLQPPVTTTQSPTTTRIRQRATRPTSYLVPPTTPQKAKTRRSWFKRMQTYLAGEASPVREVPITPRAARTLGVDFPKGSDRPTVMDPACTTIENELGGQVQVGGSEDDSRAATGPNKWTLRGRGSQYFHPRKRSNDHVNSPTMADNASFTDKGRRFLAFNAFSTRSKYAPPMTMTPVISSPMLTSTTAPHLVYNKSNIRAGPHHTQVKEDSEKSSGVSILTPIHETYCNETGSAGYSDDDDDDDDDDDYDETNTVYGMYAAQPASYTTSTLIRSATTPDMHMAQSSPYELHANELSDVDEEKEHPKHLQKPIFGGVPNYSRSGRLTNRQPQFERSPLQLIERDLLDQTEAMLQEEKLKLERIISEREAMDLEVAQMKAEHEKFMVEFEERYRTVDLRGAITVRPGMVKVVDIKATKKH
jgi:hypothetical protein